MSFVVLFAGILLLIVLIAWVKVNAFLVFLIVSLGIGLASGMSVSAVTASVQAGMGELLGSLLAILVVGAMLGKLIADQGAAQKIAAVLMKSFGRKNIVWAVVLTSFIVGIPLFYGIGFVLMVPLIITISYKYDIPAVYIGLPMLSALSVDHGYLPPHPAPVALVGQFHADLGLTLLLGLIAAVPSILVAGPLFGLTLKKYRQKPLATFAGRDIPDNELPSLTDSLISALLPVFLVAAATICKLLSFDHSVVGRVLMTLGDPVIALLLTLAFGIWAFVLKKGGSVGGCMDSMTDAVKDIAMILLIVGGAGGLKQVLTDSGTNAAIAGAMQSLHMHPLLAAWSIAAFIRVCLGSATVAGLTAAGIVAPLMAASHVNPSLMVLATGAGSLMFSHVNDSGFWLFKEYFNLSVRDTFKTWSVMESLVSVTGFAIVLLMNLFIGG